MPKSPCPLLLVKVIMVAPSPLSFLFMSMSLSLCCLHIKLHLTSISVIKLEHLAPAPLQLNTSSFAVSLYPAIPPISYSLQSPFSDLPLSTTPFVFHFCSLILTTWLIFAGNCYTSVSTCCLMALLSLCMPFLQIHSFSLALIYTLLKRLHTVEWINTKHCKKWRVFISIIWGSLNKILIVSLNQITPVL